jgi:CubicO group peptidase (beta-lactamase class C family)
MKFSNSFTAAVYLFLVLFSPVAYSTDKMVERCGFFSASGSGQTGSKPPYPEIERRILDFIGDSGVIPGLAIAIIDHGAVTYSKGFGYRDLGNCKRVTADTRFYLKSTTKSFLGMAAALLHEEGAINLDAPISDYLPDLKLPGELNASQVSLRDHFTHTQPYFDGGMNYRTAFPGNLPDDEFISHANKFSQVADIGFRYSNFGPIMGAHAINVHTGQHWRDLIRERVFAAAGMDNSFTLMAAAQKGPIATSYLQDESGRFIATITKTDPQMHAAGGTVSTVTDLSRWVRLNLSGGSIDGKQVFARRAVEHAQSRLVYLDEDFLDFHRFAHGLGLYSADYEGDLLLHHFGGETHVSFMPEHGIGIVILTNAIADGVAVTHRLAATIYDVLLGKKDIDKRSDDRLKAISEWRSNREERKAAYFAQQEEQSQNLTDSLPAERLPGSYIDPRLGKIVVNKSSTGLELSFGEIRSPLRKLNDGYLAGLIFWGQPPELLIFRYDEEGRALLDWDGRIFYRETD